MSQRITKEIASAVAKELLAQKQSEINDLINSRSEYVTSVLVGYLPDGLLKQFDKFKQYFRTTSGIYLIGDGLPRCYRSYRLTGSYPLGRSEWVEITPEESKKVIDFNYQIEDKEKEIADLRQNIEVALYNLRTYANVEKEFPEAFKLLPPSKINTALAINIKDIRCKLDKANC